MAQATDLVGIVPFDWQRLGNIFVMYFGVDTVELARAAKRRLEESSFKANFMSREEEFVAAAKLLRRLEGEGVEVGLVTRAVRSLDGGWETEIIDWRGILTNGTSIKNKERQLNSLPETKNSMETTRSEYRDEIFRTILSTINPTKGWSSQASSEEEKIQRVEVSALAICWHLAALGDPAIRNQLIQRMIDWTFELVCGLEAKKIARAKGLTVEKVLRELREGMGLAKATEVNNQTQCATQPKYNTNSPQPRTATSIGNTSPDVPTILPACRSFTAHNRSADQAGPHINDFRRTP